MTARGFSIEFDPGLAEDCILLAVEKTEPETRIRFRRERNGIYALRDAEAREGAFAAFSSRWFLELDLGRPLLALLEEYPTLGSATARCVVLKARGRKEEGADVHEARRGTLPVLLLKLLPETLLSAQALQSLLRHELAHVADMIDPSFGYERDLPIPDSGPSFDNLVRAKYHIVWDTTIDGRLRKAGWLPPEAEEIRRREFSAGFPGLGDRAQEAFDRFFRGVRPTHAEILAFLLARGSGVSPVSQAPVDGRCGLCRFPTAFMIESGRELTPEVLDEIRSDFPGWEPGWKICRQCADIYDCASRLRHGDAVQKLKAMGLRRKHDDRSYDDGPRPGDPFAGIEQGFRKAGN